MNDSIMQAVAAELAEQGMRLADEHESGWFVRVSQLDNMVWATYIDEVDEDDYS